MDRILRLSAGFIVLFMLSGCNLSGEVLFTPDQASIKSVSTPVRQVTLGGSAQWTEQGKSYGQGYHGRIEVLPVGAAGLSGGGYRIISAQAQSR